MKLLELINLRETRRRLGLNQEEFVTKENNSAGSSHRPQWVVVYQ